MSSPCAKYSVFAFPSLIGSIEMARGGDTGGGQQQFPSLIGSIEILIIASKEEQEQAFPSLIGSIEMGLFIVIVVMGSGFHPL